MEIGFHLFKKTAGILLGFATIVILIAFGLFWWSAETMCANREISSTPIPGTKYKVVVFERDCGATSGFSTQASIIRSTAKLKNENGNIFTADCDHGAAPAGLGGGPELRVIVIGPNVIELAHHPRVRVFDAQTNYEGICIKYSSLENR
ncbi:MAG: hypothetical protein RBR35_14340 [Salinivirgaceae bacterium]|nr:hypothetical protein [Salinivirgaceae bacterium]